MKNDFISLFSLSPSRINIKITVDPLRNQQPETELLTSSIVYYCSCSWEGGAILDIDHIAACSIICTCCEYSRSNAVDYVKIAAG
jgi:hypothetical protein